MIRAAAGSLILSALLLTTNSSASRHAREAIQPNDHTKAAGKLSNGILDIAIETRLGAWRPDGDGGNSLDSVWAFAEVGKSATTPGPMIRVPRGTRVRGSLHNTLNRPLTVFGLGTRRGPSDSIVIAAGATKTFAFSANDAGAFIYNARTHVDTLVGRDASEQQLNGAIIVDRPNAPIDRVLGITWSITVDPKSANGAGPVSMAINGRSWPHTERLTYAQGDSVHWRVINFTDYDHPMHLHGFYFRVDDRSDGVVDTLYTPAQQRMAVTEMIRPLQSVELSWKAERPGNWVFHCHYALHVSDFVTLDTKNGVLQVANQMHHESNAPHQMYGLVMGINITPKGPQSVASVPERVIRIEQRERANGFGKQPAMSFVVTKGGNASDTATMPIPAPTLVLERGKRVAVTIVNRSSQHASVHWHGIELESYPDGVPGWSGAGSQILPSIAPHDSLTVHWTPPRAGSFMYHSHFNEPRQMGDGLYGPIIVVEPGAKYDPETDRTFFFGTAGYIESLTDDDPKLLLNGHLTPPPMELRAHTTYRFRFFNLAGDNATLVALRQGDAAVEWKAVAKDGYPLPASQATMQPAQLLFDPGEIYDFEFTPKEAGKLTFAFAPRGKNPKYVEVPVTVR
jgi:FtsP/CotA-like multicopper oxidase with cupredoxin domain